MARGSPVPISKVVWELLSRSGLGSPGRTERLQEDWAQVVGDQLARHSRVVRVSRGVLEVVVSSSALLQELSFRRAEILALLQKRWPQTGLRDVRFRLGSID